jgi:hypothetical protein
MMKTRVASFCKTSAASFSKTYKVSCAKKIWIALPMAAFALSACVTINIYFPAAAAEKAADKIIDEVWQTQHSDKPVTPAAKETK